MNRLRYILLIFSIIISLAGVAQTPPMGGIRIDKSVEDQWEVHFETSRPNPRLASDGFTEIRIEGLANGVAPIGMPDQPIAAQLVALPRGSTIEASNIQFRADTIQLGTRLAPIAPPYPKDSEPTRRLANEACYQHDGFVSVGRPFEVEYLGTMGEVDLYRLLVRPTSYNPVSQQLAYITALQASLTIHSTKYLPQANPLPERYLIVVPQTMHAALTPFKRWKQQEGYQVEEIIIEEANRDSIKSLISTRYEVNHNAARYLLLVGDAEQIPPFVGTSRPEGFSSHPTDLPYADYTGDFLPDLLVGRWPVRDTAELGLVIEKTLLYEQFLQLDTTALKRMLLVAGTESTLPAPTTTNGQVNYLAQRFAQTNASLDTLCYHNPNSALQANAILSDVEQGVGLLNYTAHCTSAGWTSPEVRINSFDSINQSQPTVFVNNCCLSNAFTGDCFGEQLLRKPNGGAVGVIGATNSTLWNEDYYWAVGPKYPFTLSPTYDSLLMGAFDRFLLPTSEGTMGSLLIGGNLSVSAFGSPFDRFYWEIYCLLGDPSLRPFIGVPQPAWLTVPDTIERGAMGVQISAPAGTTVSALQGEQLLGVIKVGNQASAWLPFSNGADTSDILFTLTGRNRQPVSTVSHVAPSEVNSLTIEDISTSDSTLILTLHNIGPDTLFGVQVDLSPLALSDDNQATLNATSLLIGTIIPEERRTAALTVDIERWGTHWAATLKATDTGGTCGERRLDLHHTMSEAPPSVSFRLLGPDSNAVRTIAPQHTYIVQTLTYGNYDSLWTSLVNLPDSISASSASHYASLRTSDSVSHIMVMATIGRGNFHQQTTAYFVAGGRQESFETQQPSYPWSNQSLHPWIIDSSESHSGQYSMRSGPIDYRQTSDLELHLFLPETDSISFWVKTSCETRYDKLIFSTDGNKRQEFWGEEGWRKAAFTIGPGEHTLRWRYVKDESGSAGSDCVWIDDLRLPLAAWDSAYGWFDTAEQLGITPTDIDSSSLTCYPNPADNHLWVSSPSPKQLLVIDAVGRRVAEITLDGENAQHIDTRYWPNGVYHLITDDNIFYYRRTILITHP